MSKVPLFYRDWWDDEASGFGRPSRLLDQQFGLGLRRDDLNELISSFKRSSRVGNYMRPWSTSSVLQRQESGSTIQQDQEKFQVHLDVQQFAPSEITVKTSGNNVVIEGKHEEKQDEHGFISRHFVRRYILPQDHDISDVVSSLSSDGILTVTAPKKQPKPTGDRVVHITQTGPAKPAVDVPTQQTTVPTSHEASANKPAEAPTTTEIPTKFE